MDASDTVKLAAIGLGGVLIGVVFFGGKSKGRQDPGIEATLESMRIASQTNLGYGAMGVESQRIQAALMAQKDTNRTSIQIAQQEHETVRLGINRTYALENRRIEVDRSKFESGLMHELAMMTRWITFEDSKFGKELSARTKSEEVRAKTDIELAKLQAGTVRYAAERQVAVSIGQQQIQQQALEQDYTMRLLSLIPELGTFVSQSAGNIYRAFAGPGPESGYGGSGVADSRYARTGTFPAGSPGITYQLRPQAGSGQGTTGFEVHDGLSDADRAIGAGTGALGGAATGAMVGSVVPGIGTAIGAGVGAAAGAAGGAGGGMS